MLWRAEGSSSSDCALGVAVGSGTTHSMRSWDIAPPTHLRHALQHVGKLAVELRVQAQQGRPHADAPCHAGGKPAGPPWRKERLNVSHRQEDAQCWPVGKRHGLQVVFTAQVGMRRREC